MQNQIKKLVGLLLLCAVKAQIVEVESPEPYPQVQIIQPPIVEPRPRPVQPEPVKIPETVRVDPVPQPKPEPQQIDYGRYFTDLRTAYTYLGDAAKKALLAAKIDINSQEEYIKNQRWGDIIPSYSFQKDPLFKNCLGRIEVFSTRGCDSGGGYRVNNVNWEQTTRDLNRVSGYDNQCLLNYDLVGDGRQRFDQKVTCSNDSISISLYTPNSNCNVNSFQGTVTGFWNAGNQTCVDTPSGPSFKLIRNDTRNLLYLRNAFEAERFLKSHQYANRAGSCVIRNFDVFVDSDCQVKANSVDDDVESALDVANSMAAHSSQQCGVVGHLFPMEAPFARVGCNSTHFDLTSYFDFRCREKQGQTFYYRWGQCLYYPWTTKGVKFIKLYQQERAPYFQLVNNTSDTDYTVDARLLFTLSGGLILLACVIGCMGFSIYQMKQSATSMAAMNKMGDMPVMQTELGSNYGSQPNNNNTNFNINP